MKGKTNTQKKKSGQRTRRPAEHRFIHFLANGNRVDLLIESTGRGQFGEFEIRWQRRPKLSDYGEYGRWRDHVCALLSAEAGYPIRLMTYVQEATT